MAHYCGKCGAKLEDNAKFCWRCGTSVMDSNANAYISTVPINSPDKQVNTRMKWIPFSIVGGIAVIVIATVAIIHLGGNSNTTTPTPVTSESNVPESSTGSNVNSAIDNSQTDQRESNQTIPVELVSGDDFSEGIAWVTYTETGNEKLGIIHTDGEVLPVSLENEGIPGNASASKFSEGYSYINYEDENQIDQFVIVDTSGTISVKSPTDADYKILTGGNRVYLVQKTVKNMTENETRYGIINTAGDWICNPSEQTILELSDPEQRTYYTERGNVSFSYYGEHIFGALYKTKSDSVLCLYNADTSQTTEFENTSICGDFEAGATILTSGSDIYRLGTDFSLNLIMSDRPDGSVYYKGGTFFTGQTEYSSRGPNPCIKNGKFYNIDGSVKVDLSQYTLVAKDAEGLYRYVDGYAAVVIYGADYQGYMAIIDENGQFAFEPVALAGVNSDSDLIGVFSDGAIPIQKQSEGWGILTTDGDYSLTIIPGGKVDDFVFHDGYAWFYEDEGGYYVAKDGSVLTAYMKS